MTESHNMRREVYGLIARYWRWIAIIIILLAALYWLWSLLGPKPPIECVTVDETLAGAVIPDEAPFLVRNQVIVTGPQAQVEKVLTSFDFLKPIRTCTFNYLSRDRDKANRTMMNLYHIPRDGPSVKDVVEQINEQAQGRFDEKNEVFAEPNLLIGASADVCGNPEHGSGGSPFGAPTLLPVGEEEAVKLFWEQWAFETINAGPSFKEELDGAAIMHQGEDVIVGVFDTAPFLDPWDSAANVPERCALHSFLDPSDAELLTIETQETIKWINPTMDVEPLTLKVIYPKVVNPLSITNSLNVTRTDEITGAPVYDVRDHGLFVTGLVHAVAPASELRLIKVLNDFGCGDLYTLNASLGYFVSQVVEEAKNDDKPLKGAVINLSLGIHAPDEDTSIVGCESESEENINNATQVVSDTNQIEIKSLCDILSDARDKGIIIVGAAGNDSGRRNDPSQVHPSQVPAIYDSVISVMASNRDGDPSCFSNEGDVAAPGGNGRVPNCGHKVAGCGDDCDDDIISLVLFPPKGNTYWPTHYGYWRGTSFAAPLVSGLAALIPQERWIPPDEQPGGQIDAQSVLPSVVATAIACGADDSVTDVIDITNTITDCLP